MTLTSPSQASSPATQPGRPRGWQLVMAGLVGVMVAFTVAPGAALADDAQVKLALRPVGQAGSFFDLTMRPGETRSLDVEIANAGGVALAARTYAADVYTIINGGFGGRLRAEPETGTTTWLDYTADVLQLPAGNRVLRPFTVTVPSDAGPGEYITSLVLENDQPIPGGGAVALDQIIRQAIGVVVTVPGERAPALAIGEAYHKVVAGRSIVSVAVANTGNVRLKPVIGFTLLDAAGAQVSQATMQMDTFYAHTNTFVEVPLAALLQPGRYTVHLTLDDATQDVRADQAAIAFVVEAAPETAHGSGEVPGLTQVFQAIGDHSPLLLLAGAIVAGVVLSVLVGWFVLRRRRGTRTSER